MTLSGCNIIAGEKSRPTGEPFRAIDPAKNVPIDPEFRESSTADVDRAMKSANEAFVAYRNQPPERIAEFLDRIGQEIVALGDELIARASAETGLPAARLTGERGRTVGQLHLFAEMVREGSWLEAVIDHADPDRKPLPKPDVRRMLIPIGPVVVFGASNFPLAFSVAGGDTASALAAGCPVVVKAHPGHPGTSELVAEAIGRAIVACNVPKGVFSMIHGRGTEVGMALVKHPLTKAVGFTGSLAGGRALFDAAMSRPEPIPVYAEMGSVNPVFILPGALKQRAATIANGLADSVTLGVGQFCTKPGIAVVMRGEGSDELVRALGQKIQSIAPATMLNPGISSKYSAGMEKLGTAAAVQSIARSSNGNAQKNEATVAAFRVSAKSFLADPHLQEEVFGPITLLVECDSVEQMQQAVDRLAGQLTVTLHGTDDDWTAFAPIIEQLRQKAGRLVINGFPTGVEVCAAMNHGGPYPATTDVRTTSVGSFAIKRFARPICLQNFPGQLLPPELQDPNPRGIWRLVDGQMKQ